MIRWEITNYHQAYDQWRALTLAVTRALRLDRLVSWIGKHLRHG